MAWWQRWFGGEKAVASQPHAEEKPPATEPPPGAEEEEPLWQVDPTVPYLGYLPEPDDATAALLRQMVAMIRNEPEKAPRGIVKAITNGPEAPSNLLAFTLQMAALGHDLRLELELEDPEAIPQPDPRRPMGIVEYWLWDYEGITPRPAVAPPGEEVLQSIAALAREPYDYRLGWQHAGETASRLGTGKIEELLGAMVHPPAIEGDTDALAWLPRVQLAAAQVLAQIDSGWTRSIRRRILTDLARGPRDWTTSAVIVALAQLAHAEPDVVHEVRDVFYLLLNHRPAGFCCYLHPLLANWLLLPDLPPEERSQLIEMIRSMAPQEE